MRRGARTRPLTGVDARHAAGDQGSRRDPRPAHHVRLVAAGALGPRLRLPDGRPHEGRRLHRDRQDQRARVRARVAHLQRRVRPHAQPVRPHPHRWRQQRRRGGGDSHPHAARRRWQRLHGLVAEPSGVEQHLRVPAEPGPSAQLARARRVPRPAQHRRADGPHGGRRRDAARHAGRVRREGADRVVGSTRRVHYRRRHAQRPRRRPAGHTRRLAR